MQPVSVICLFCEDIRQEHNDVNTIVGILPDTININAVPAVLPKLGIYVRINISPEEDPGSISLALSMPGAGADIAIGEIDQSLIARARKDAEAVGSPIAGIVSRIVFSPFEIRQPGRIKVLANIRGEPVVCGSLNIVLTSLQRCLAALGGRATPPFRPQKMTMSVEVSRCFRTKITASEILATGHRCLLLDFDHLILVWR